MARRGQAVLTCQSDIQEIILAETDGAGKIEGFVDRKAAGIGMMAIEDAARRGSECLRQMRTGRAVIA